jgi:hypothetical protein
MFLLHYLLLFFHYDIAICIDSNPRQTHILHLIMFFKNKSDTIVRGHVQEM